MQLVETKGELERNLTKFCSYASSRREDEQKFFKELLRRGACFVVYQDHNRIWMGPSRFLGYAENGVDSHDQDQDKHGRDTNQVIQRLYGKRFERDGTTESMYDSVCRRQKITPKRVTKKFMLVSGILPVDPLTFLTSFALEETEADLNRNGAFSEPRDEAEARIRVERSILIRRGQPEFRKNLLKEYQHRCAATGCNVEEVLEAAHIEPYCEGGTNTLTNGLLLRADIHTLFDLGLLGINPDNLRIWIAPSLIGTTYAELAGRSLSLPRNPSHHPDKKAIRSHRDKFNP